MKKLEDKQEAADDNNILNENEEGQYIEWKYILQKQRELQEQFNAIINKQTKTAYNINLNLVLVSLYSLTPPLCQEVMNYDLKSKETTIRQIMCILKEMKLY